MCMQSQLLPQINNLTSSKMLDRSNAVVIETTLPMDEKQSNILLMQ
ncbi:Hypothetical protein BJL86_2901 [Dietzia timorensis]|uniref:Uncharacterized protein n=1 Tax=Dietzia timorensis TaxID=499555 RepID=A0A173LQ47_9ACTN|nr:Hypothetical protein BJL86_2901 [Dietzia timorensis]